jgi:hypothetical protein
MASPAPARAARPAVLPERSAMASDEATMRGRPTGTRARPDRLPSRARTPPLSRASRRRVPASLPLQLSGLIYLPRAIQNCRTD